MVHSFNQHIYDQNMSYPENNLFTFLMKSKVFERFLIVLQYTFIRLPDH